MLEEIHEDCGVALIRLLKPLDYYEKKYGSRYFGLNKLYLLMEKQHNRGQEGAGMAKQSLATNTCFVSELRVRMLSLRYSRE